MKQDDVARLLAIGEIHQLKARYCRLIDTKQWAELEKLFTPDARLDGFGSVPDGTDPATFVAGVSARLDDAITIHHVQAPELVFTAADAARGIWSMMDYVDFQPVAEDADPSKGRGWVGWGYYEETYIRIDGAWRISFMRLARQRMDKLTADHPFANFSRHGPSKDWL